MYDCCCKEDTARIGKSLEIARAFALIGVLRRISQTCPEDLVFVYANDTDCSGLSWAFRSWQLKQKDGTHGTADIYSKVPRTWEFRHSGEADTVIPECYKKMAMEYMVRCFYDQLHGLDRLIRPAENRNSDHAGFQADPVFPQYARELLDRVVLTEHTTMAEASEDINPLWAALIPVARNTDRWEDRFTREKRNCDVLSLNQMRVIDTLRRIYNSTVEYYAGRDMIPEKGILDSMLNALEILILFGMYDSYSEIEHARHVYEYARYGCKVESAQGGVKINKFELNRVYNPDLTNSGKIDTAIGSFQYFSPEASICTGHNLALDVSYGPYSRITTNTHDDVNWSYPLREYLKKLNPRPVPEVKLFIVKEIEVQRRKLERLAEQRKHCGAKHDCGCCCDAPCCGEAAPTPY